MQTHSVIEERRYSNLDPRTVSCQVRSSDFIARSAWAALLNPAELSFIQTQTTSRRIKNGGYIFHRGDNAIGWIGVMEGLVKIVNVSDDGRLMTHTAIPSGSWFGEDAMQSRAVRNYDAIALRECHIAVLPRSAFNRIFRSNHFFNQFVFKQMGERLRHCMALLEFQRLLCPEERVARTLALLYNPILNPEMSPRLPVTQQEIAYFIGLSRQLVNRALHALERANLLEVASVGIFVRDIEGLRDYSRTPTSGVGYTATRQRGWHA